MITIRKNHAGMVLALTLALTGLAACGNNAAPPIVAIDVSASAAAH